jgi:hypothetical protein
MHGSQQRPIHERGWDADPADRTTLRRCGNDDTQRGRGEEGIPIRRRFDHRFDGKRQKHHPCFNDELLPEYTR